MTRQPFDASALSFATDSPCFLVFPTVGGSSCAAAVKPCPTSAVPHFNRPYRMADLNKSASARTPAALCQSFASIPTSGGMTHGRPV